MGGAKKKKGSSAAAAAPAASSAVVEAEAAATAKRSAPTVEIYDPATSTWSTPVRLDKPATLTHLDRLCRSDDDEEVTRAHEALQGAPNGEEVGAACVEAGAVPRLLALLAPPPTPPAAGAEGEAADAPPPRVRVRALRALTELALINSMSLGGQVRRGARVH